MSEKNKGGRPLKFKTVKELQEKIDAYFEDCDKHGKPYTITGLALALDTSRKVLMEYEERDGYSNAIKKAKLRVENYVEESLWSPKIATGVIFNLKNNFGWSDKQEIEHSGGVTQEIRHDLRKLDPGELAQLETLLKKSIDDAPQE